tara:strand:- start:5829 stop:6722 length:894 start_codon:yes stop_codon:yes gene_type:complete
MKQPKILILGSIALDSIETSYGSRKDLLGGSATYAAVSSSKFVKPNLVGIVGSDFSELHKQILVDSCESLEDLISKKGPTFRWGGKYFDNGDERETLFTELGVFDGFMPSVSEINNEPDYVFLANIGPDLQLSVLDQLKGKPVVILDTMNLWIDIAKDKLLEVLGKTNILLINETELVELTEIEDFYTASKKIQSQGPKVVIVKHGSRGSVCYSEGTSFSLGVIPNLTVKDPTGAGDSFGGGLVSALAQGLTLKEAIIRGTVMASFCIEDFGINALLASKKKIIDSRSLFLSESLKH